MRKCCQAHGDALPLKQASRGLNTVSVAEEWLAVCERTVADVIGLSTEGPIAKYGANNKK